MGDAHAHPCSYWLPFCSAARIAIDFVSTRRKKCVEFTSSFFFVCLKQYTLKLRNTCSLCEGIPDDQHLVGKNREILPEHTPFPLEIVCFLLPEKILREQNKKSRFYKVTNHDLFSRTTKKKRHFTKVVQ